MVKPEKEWLISFSRKAAEQMGWIFIPGKQLLRNQFFRNTVNMVHIKESIMVVLKNYDNICIGFSGKIGRIIN